MSFLFVNKTILLINLKTRTAMNAKVSVFVICVEAIIYWLIWMTVPLRASAFTSATLAKTLTKSELVKLLPLLHTSPRIRSIMCNIQFKVLKDKYSQTCIR